jgi:hypothetical protein
MTAKYAIDRPNLPVLRAAMNEANVRLLVRYCFSVTFVCASLFPQPFFAADTALPDPAHLSQSPLTVLMDFESPHSDTSLNALRYSLNKLLNPGGLSVQVQLKSELPASPQFGQLVVFKMKGSCSLTPLHSSNPSLDAGPLASAFTSDGQVLHFGEVQCDRVRHSLQRIPGFAASLKNQQTYGSALAIVIAHEVYHMLGNATSHTHEGLTKSSLSASELFDSRMTLPPSAISILQNANPVAH